MNKPIIYLILCLSFFTGETIFAQVSKADSIDHLLNLHQTDDTVKVNLLNEAANSLFYHEKEKILQYATQAEELGDKLNYRKGKIESLLLIGNYHKTNNPALALECSQKAMGISENINYTSGIVNSLNLEGNAYKALGKYAQAHESFQKALTISENIENKHLIAKCLTNIGSSY